MEVFTDPEKKVMCPYNHAHYILVSRLNSHLVKCSKNYPDVEVVRCDFNSTHVIPKEQSDYHHRTCPDRRKIENKITVVEGEANETAFPVEYLHVQGEESWDDVDVPTYDPQEYCQNAPVLRRLDVASAAKRKNFRMEERLRHSQLRPNETVKDSSAEEARKAARMPKATSSKTLREEEPDEIKALLNRVRSGANKSYLPTGAKK